MKDDDPNVFPLQESPWSRGITLRDFFAAVALIAKVGEFDHLNDPNYERAQNAYLQADAMLMVRKEPK